MIGAIVGEHRFETSGTDLLAAESIAAGAGSTAGNALTTGVKGAKLSWNGSKKGNKAAGAMFKKSLKKGGFVKGAAGGVTGSKIVGKALTAGLKGKKFGKKGKTGKFGKLTGSGFNKNFGSVKTFGLEQAIKFGKTGGIFASSKTASSAAKKGHKFAIGGMAGGKKGGRADKAFIWARNGKKDKKSAKSSAGSAFSKGGGSLETFQITKHGKKPFGYW